jgi:acylphosphatase
MVLHFLIQGRVQGVGFRWFVNREASELNLRGWVRNTEEGDVEVLASGKESDLAEPSHFEPPPRRTLSLRRIDGPRISKGARVDRLVERTLSKRK